MAVKMRQSTPSCIYTRVVMNSLGRKYDGLGLTQKQTVWTKGAKDENKTGACMHARAQHTASGE